MPADEEVRIWMAGPAQGELLKVVTLKTEDTYPSSGVMVNLSNRDLTWFAYKNPQVSKKKKKLAEVG